MSVTERGSAPRHPGCPPRHPGHPPENPERSFFNPEPGSGYIFFYLYAREVTDAQRVEIGCPVHGKRPSTVHRPDALAEADIVYIAQHILKLVNIRPVPGTMSEEEAEYDFGVRIFWGILGPPVAGDKFRLAAPPEVGSDLPHSTFTHRKSYRFDFEGAGGKTVYFCLRYENGKGGEGGEGSWGAEYNLSYSWLSHLPLFSANCSLLPEMRPFCLPFWSLCHILIIVTIISLYLQDAKGACSEDMSGTERKHSKKRDAILEIIKSTQSHPGAQWVYQKLKPAIPALSLGTVYRNISLFREEGSVMSVCVMDGEERFDGRVEPHPHLICCRCGKVLDLPCPADEAGPEAMETGDFVIDHRKTLYYGLCGDCAAAARTEDPPKPDSQEEFRANL